MAFKRTPQAFNASIKEVVLGTGDKAITLGGENVLPFYTFDGEIKNSPKVGIEITDAGFDKDIPGIAEFYAGCETIADIAKRAASAEGADFLAVRLDGASPDDQDKPVEEMVALMKEIADAVDCPIVVEGCKNVEKDAKLFDKIAEALSDKNILVMSAKEDNYKNIAASVGMAYGQKIGAESAVDINLAKQLNVMINQMGIKNEGLVMNTGTAAAGYGFEYVVSTIDRIKDAALSQNDVMLQMPIITPVASEAWNVKEALVSEEDFPEWGPREERGIDMEICTAAAVLSEGSNGVILKHPTSVKTIAKLISELM